MSDLPKPTDDIRRWFRSGGHYEKLVITELDALEAENATMRKLIAKFAQGAFTLRHALTADEIQLMAECADVDKAEWFYVQEGVGRELPPTPQP